ncbi:sugar transferase [Campylobacter devanensis]|uniref:Uncharacterized protein n=1 Tax=Campylobacter devanensis TaxID=3161138 RepID=A0A1X9SQL5_9BACT|nr:hypothetical protein [Campylobacter lanienae]ARQ98539.1 hypothetical protein CIGN_0227 [Campylobacter lanienae]SUX01593.1 sugar transferase [Campylobacter lanienae]
MKNIILLGGSNSVMVNGLQKGLREYANVTNLALGGTTSLQNLYELKREKNQEAIKNADLIVTESVINELDNHNIIENLSLEIIFKNLQYLYATLYELKKPVCILILPYRTRDYQIIINMHRFLANYFGLNIIDMQSYYEKSEIIQFGNKFGGHQLAIVNRYVGKEIAKNIDCFKASNKNLDLNLPEFKILTPQDMKRVGNFKIFNPKNSMYDEIVYRLESDNYLSFEGYEGYQIIGMHGWNLEINGEITKLNWAQTISHCASIHLKNKDKNIVKPTSKLNIFCEIQAEPIIDSSLIVKFNDENLANSESYINARPNTTNSVSLPYFDLIAFFLCKPNSKMKLFDLNLIPSDKDIEIDRDIDRSYLMPNIVFFKDSMEFIDEYIGHLYPNITKHIDRVLSPQIINRLKEQLATPSQSAQPSQPTTPQPTPQEQINSLKEEINKKDKAIKEFSDRLSAQEASLKSTNEILRKRDMEIKNLEITSQNIKNHLSYKLGNALIKAHKQWYKGGYIKFIFEAIKIKKEHNKTKI